MATIHINWKNKIDWPLKVQIATTYFGEHHELKFGPNKLNKAIPLLNELCRMGAATRNQLSASFKLESYDDMATILSNVTMAIQGHGEVLPPEEGGWYVAVDNPRTYVICPGFAAAWNAGK